jgi:acetoin utilization deacetylase AcuC-like enzyme
MICVSNPLLAEYRPPPGHPEHPHRISYVREFLEERFGKEIVSVSRRMATPEELCSVHAREYIEYLFSLKAETHLDYETVFSERGLEEIRCAAGICLDLMEYILSGTARKGFALIRPPGHHAGYNRAMGYCIVNNIALAVQKGLQKLQRIAVIDWDAHHGNGTQELFEETDRVFFVDIHQDNLFPIQSGAADETGKNKGKGFTLNIPLPAGSTGVQYLDSMDAKIYPLLKAYKPELLCVSAGFDAVAGDLEGGMTLTPQDFGAMTERICTWADEFCGGSVFMTLEGGYRIESLSAALSECIGVLQNWRRHELGR